MEDSPCSLAPVGRDCIVPLPPLSVEWTAYAQARLGHDVCVDHRRLDVLVPEQFLHGANIVTVFQQVRGERVSECVTSHPLADPRHVGRVLQGAVNSTGMGVPANSPTRLAIQSD